MIATQLYSDYNKTCYATLLLPCCKLKLIVNTFYARMWFYNILKAFTFIFDSYVKCAKGLYDKAVLSGISALKKARSKDAAVLRTIPAI